MVDLLPNKYSKAKLKAPMTILKQQASLVGKKTNHKVVASVERAAIPVRNDDALRYHFLFSTPARPIYHYHHFSIEHDVDLYPVFFYLDEDTQEDVESKIGKWYGILTAKSEEELELVLREVLRADETQRIIKKIYAHSKPA